MIGNGLTLDKINLVGFSVGAQISGFIGKKMQKLSGGKAKIPRIVALEPTLITDLPTLISPNDADFVMTVKTEYRFSDEKAKGHANFIFNKDLLFMPCYFSDFGYCKIFSVLPNFI